MGRRAARPLRAHSHGEPAPRAPQHSAPPSRFDDLRPQDLVDEAVDESFPASDAPAYSALHAGAPALRAWSGDHNHELRARLRADLERFAVPRPRRDSSATLGHGVRQQREDAVARAMLEADRVVVREPIDTGARVRTIESELVGAVRLAPCVIVGVRYDREDDTRLAAFLALVRALRSSRMRRSVRFVALADAPSTGGGATYARRLQAAGTRVHVALCLATLGLARARPGCIFFAGDFRLRSWAYAASHAFETSSWIPARTVCTPAWAAWAVPDADLREARRLRHVGWPVVTVADRSPWGLRRVASPDVDRMAAAIPGIVAAVERLAGGRV